MKRSQWRAAAGLAALASALPALAADADELARKFGARESVRQIALSPGGTRIAVIAPRPGGGDILAVADLAGDGLLKPILNSSGDPEALSYCRWGTDEILLCSARIVRDNGDERVGFTRLFSLRSDGSGLKMVSRNTNDRSLYVNQYGGAVIDWQAEGAPGRVLMTRYFVPERDIGRIVKKDDEGLGVEAVDLQTLRRSTVEKARREAIEYITDGHGRVRVMGFAGREGDGYLSGSLRYNYRAPGNDDWKLLSKAQMAGQGVAGFEPYAVDSRENAVYGFNDVDGFRALVKVALDETRAETVVLKRSDVDVDSLIRIGRGQRIVGASYATDRRTTEFFDPELKKLAAALRKALPGDPNLDFVDASADESKLLLLAWSDTHPGTFYLFDKATRKLSEVLPVRNQLAGLASGEMKPIRFPGPDGVEIPGYLTLPPGSAGRNLPAIVMPHGGPGARDEWGFDWLAQYFAARGYAVLQPNFRGSAGYGSAWFQKNGFKSWRTAIGDVNAAGRWLQAQGIAASGKLAIFGWSYGGYAALQSPVLDPDLFKAIVAVAPVTDLAKLRDQSKGYTDYKLVRNFIGEGPHVREGSPAQNVAAIKAPVLIWHGEKDENVSVEESRFMARQLRDAGKSVQYVEFPRLDHFLDSDEARARMLAESDAFIRKALGL